MFFIFKKIISFNCCGMIVTKKRRENTILMKKSKYLAAALATTLTWSAISPFFATTLVHANTEAVITETADSLIFSEYVHGGSNAKAFEIVNTGTLPVNLKEYKLKYIGFTNSGGTSESEHQFSDYVLEPGATYVVYHSSSPAAMKEHMATISAPNKAEALSTGVMGFNGDDALVLVKGDAIVDIIGSTNIVAGVKPYNLSTLIRQPEIKTGITELANTDYDPVNEVQWKMHKTESDFSTLGTHEFNSGEEIPDTQAPTIEHTPVTSSVKGEPLTVSATVTDDRVVRNVFAYWREIGSETFTSQTMTFIDGMYQAELPTQAIVTAIEYYIVATDGTNEEQTQTYTVTIDTTDVQGPIITNTTPRNKSNIGAVETTDVTVTFSDDSTVVRGTMSINGNIVDAVLTDTTFTATNVAVATENVVEVILEDEYGNTTTYEWTFKASESTFEHYYGQLHAHSNLSDGAGTPDEAFAYADEVANLDFFALTDHSNWFDNDTSASLADGSMSKDWQTGHNTADEANRPGEYTAIYGYEMTWSGSTGGYGHINTFNTPGFETRANKSMDLQTYYATIADYEASVNQLNHPGKTFGDFVDFGYYTAAADEVVNLVEVGNGEGPIRGTGYFPSYDYYTRALDKGWHVSPSNNQDNHKGNWGTSNTARTVVIAEENTREGLYEAMSANRVYASEDSNLQIDYTLNGEVMGTQLPAVDTVEIKVALSDPDNETIGKVSIITDGGYVAASKYIDGNSGTWEVELPAQFSYYYVRVDQGDKDIAVTSPVWVGEKENVSISSIKTESDQVVKGDTFNATATITNNSDQPLSDLTVEWYIDNVEGTPVATSTIDTVVAGKMVDITQSFETDSVGSMTIYARVEMNGKYHTTSKKMTVVNASDVTQIFVDGSKYNQYVTGNYAGKIENFKTIMSDRNVLVKIGEPGSTLTDEMLTNMSALIITDPEGTGSSDYGTQPANYSNEELAVIARYVENGGNIIVTTRADYKDASGEYSNSAQLNPLLEAIGTTLRVNDDQVQDDVTNSGSTYRLAFNQFVEDPYGLTKNLTSADNYTFYSGASVLVNESGTKTNDQAVCLVQGHETTASVNTDKADDHVAVETGNVCAIGAQQLANGSKVIVAGTTFFSDFEISNDVDNVTANAMLTTNIMNWLAPEKEAPLISIANFRVHPEGIRFTVEGYVTSQSSAVEPKNGFFDTIHIQDETGGLTVFGISERELQVGQKVRITGYSDVYDGDIEISITDEAKDVIILDADPLVIEPAVLSTVETMNYKHNGGQLVQTQGIVTRIEGQSLYLNDGSGESRVFLDGYIGNGIDESSKGKWDTRIEVGSYVQASGIASHDVEGARIRVRNTQEIIYMPVNKIEMQGIMDELLAYIQANGRYEFMETYVSTIQRLKNELLETTDETTLINIQTEIESIINEVTQSVETYYVTVDELVDVMEQAHELLPIYLEHPELATHETVVALDVKVAEVKSDANEQTTTTQLGTYALDVATLVQALPSINENNPATPGFGPDGDVTPELEVEITQTPGGSTSTGPSTNDGNSTEKLPSTGQVALELFTLGSTLAIGGVIVTRRRKQQ